MRTQTISDWQVQRPSNTTVAINFLRRKSDQEPRLEIASGGYQRTPPLVGIEDAISAIDKAMCITKIPKCKKSEASVVEKWFKRLTRNEPAPHNASVTSSN